MSRTTLALKRLGVAGVALVTVGAGLPTLLATSASANHATQVAISPQTQSAATGTCETFTITVSNTAGTTTDTETVTVELIDPSPANNTTEGASNTNDQSAQFCRLTAGPNDTEQFEVLAAGTNNVRQTGPTTGQTPETSQNSNRRTITLFVAGGTATFGVTNIQQETVTLRPFLDENADGAFDPNADTRGADAFAVFTPGSDQFAAGFDQTANDAVRTIQEVTPAQPQTVVAGGTQTIVVRLLNANGDEVRNADPRIQVLTGGANSAGTAGNQATGLPEGECTVSDNNGISTCTVPVQNAGSDQFRIFVNQTNGGTPGFDSTEPNIVVTRATAQAPNTNPAAARNIDLTPEGPATANAGTDRVFTATVTDVTGRAVQGVSVTFTEEGAGVLLANANAGVTNNLGQVSRTLRTAPGETGQSIVRAEIGTSGTQCGQAAGTGTGATSTTPAGNCIDSEVTNFVAASPSPSATTAPPTTPPTTTPPTSPGTTPPVPCTVPATVTLERSTITATGSSGVTVRATPNSIIDLFAYSRPSTTYRIVRSAEVGSDGIAEFRIVPPTNTRLYAQQRGCSAGQSVVLNVRTQLSLNVVRNSTRNYTFSGRALPARNGGLIVSLYRVTASGSQILTAQTRANATTGTYVINRIFTGTGRFGFVVRTGQDLQNAPGASNVRSLLVF